MNGTHMNDLRMDGELVLGFEVFIWIGFGIRYGGIWTAYTAYKRTHGKERINGLEGHEAPKLLFI